MGQHCPTGVAFSEEGFVVEAELIAQKLGLSPDAFWREMKRGIVYGVVERGEGDATACRGEPVVGAKSPRAARRERQGLEPGTHAMAEQCSLPAARLYPRRYN